jgi:hypothetical protein
MKNLKNFINKFQNKIKDKSGLTLVETVVAVFILALGISAFMVAAKNGLQSSFFAKDRTTAFYLAQEAIEVIKNNRDENGNRHYYSENVLEGDPIPWLDGIADWHGGPCGETQACGVNSWTNDIDSCSNLYQDCALYRRNDNGVFVHLPSEDNENTTATKFTRKVNMEEISPNEAKVRVTVTWSPMIGSGNLVVEEHIFNWHPLSDPE